MPLQIDFFRRLVDLLARDFFQRSTAESIVTAIRLNPAAVAFDNMARNTWTSIVSLSQHEGKLELLFEETMKRQHHNPDLPQLLREYNTENANIPAQKFCFLRYKAPSPFKILLLVDGMEQHEAKPLKTQLTAFRASHNLEFYDCWDTAANEFHLLLLLMTPSLVAYDIGYFDLANQVVEQGGRAIPVLWKSCEYENIPGFKGRISIPTNKKFLSDRRFWVDMDDAYRQVAKTIAELVTGIKAATK
jgi:hypothetical protein